jgi:hypothetical protein
MLKNVAREAQNFTPLPERTRMGIGAGMGVNKRIPQIWGRSHAADHPNPLALSNLKISYELIDLNRKRRGCDFEGSLLNFVSLNKSFPPQWLKLNSYWPKSLNARRH